MTTLRPFRASDLFTFNRVNLDHFTETYTTAYYLTYLATWPDLCFVAEHPHASASASPSGEGASTSAVGTAGGEGVRGPAPLGSHALMGYLFGKAEGRDWEREREGAFSSASASASASPSPSTRRGPTPAAPPPGRGREKERHAHVTALTVSPSYRRLGLAKSMMSLLEGATAPLQSYGAYFTDLFVRPSNALAVGLYASLEYSVYRRVREYYAGGGPGGGDEDAYDMRKALSRDGEGETVRVVRRGAGAGKGGGGGTNANANGKGGAKGKGKGGNASEVPDVPCVEPAATIFEPAYRI